MIPACYHFNVHFLVTLNTCHEITGFFLWFQRKQWKETHSSLLWKPKNLGLSTKYNKMLPQSYELIQPIPSILKCIYIVCVQIVDVLYLFYRCCKKIVEQYCFISIACHLTYTISLSMYCQVQCLSLILRYSMYINDHVFYLIKR